MGPFNRRLNRFFPILLALALAVGCAQRPVTQGKGDPADGPQGGADGGSEAPRPLSVALVVGGAGVASFATVGILKRFQQEGIRIEFIVATGWPTLFALGNGYMKSVHDLEWFAMRIRPSDLFSTGLFDFSKDFSAHDKLASLMRNVFRANDLGEANVPVIVTASNVLRGGVDVYGSGPWEPAALKALSVPGIYRPYPPGTTNAWITSLNGVDVQEALKRRPTVVVAVEMYEDYLRYIGKGSPDESGTLFRSVFARQLRQNLDAQMALAPIRGKVVLNVAPNNLDRKRDALLAGYKEASRLIAELRRELGE